MIIKYIDPTTNNIRICSWVDLIVKTDRDSDQEYMSFCIGGFNMKVNVFSNEDTIKEMLDEVFTTEKLDTTKYNDVSIGIEFEENESEDDAFIEMLNDILSSLGEDEDDDFNVDIEVDPDLYDDYSDPDEGNITYNDFL